MSVRGLSKLKPYKMRSFPAISLLAARRGIVYRFLYNRPTRPERLHGPVTALVAAPGTSGAGGPSPAPGSTPNVPLHPPGHPPFQPIHVIP